MTSCCASRPIIPRRGPTRGPRSSPRQSRAHGIAVPRLLAFEAGVYSLWERVHAETLSELPFLPRAWRELGGELARLHDRMRACDDPNGWLDEPCPYDDPGPQLHALVACGAVAADVAATLERWLDALRPALAPPSRRSFPLHNDAHGGNVMCTRDGALVALIDWGDAGWGDPAHELGSLPVESVPTCRRRLRGSGRRALRLRSEHPLGPDR
jgi:aminoglycoside phosphotransferase (APT) family kinase protein